MASPYTPQSSSGYNSTPPADDGSEIASNQVKWATIKDKLGDPVKTYADNINSEVSTAFGKILGANGVSSTAIDYTVLSSDQGKLIKCTAAVTITTPSATSVGAPFAFSILNLSSGAVVVDGNGAQTVDGSTAISIPAGGGATFETDGSNWFSHGQNISSIVQPQGRLTLTSGTAVLSSSVSAATSVYYTPYNGNLVPIYNGSIYQMRTFTELTLTLQANGNYAASTLYDIFVFDSSGTVTLGIGPAWSTSTAGSCARGTGAGTTELDRKLGYWTNKVSMTARNGASTYTVAANQGTYVGSISMDGTNGQVSCHVAIGQSRKFGIWNAYNRVPVFLQVTDSTTSWSYGSATIHPSNASTANSFTIFSGLAEDWYDLAFTQTVTQGTTPTSAIYIGYNSTTSFSGASGVPTNTANVSSTATARYLAPPALGINTITALESSNGTNPVTFNGTFASMLLSGQWRA